LTVRIDHVPLDEVLAAVARETGITIDGEPLDRRDVTKRFVSVPLAQGLKRILGRQNFTLRYSARGDPIRLELLGSPLPRPTSPRKRGLTAIQLLIAHPPVALPAHTAQVLGRRVVPLQRVLSGLRHLDPIVRNECAQTLVRALEGSPDTLAAFRRLDVAQLTQLVASQAGGGALEVAMALYRSANDPVFKGRLSLVLGSLRARTS
jgi:hypothetical protein